MEALTEKFLREEFTAWIDAQSDLKLSHFYNVWINYEGSDYDSGSKNEADMIFVEGHNLFKVVEVEIKKSQKDWMKELNAVSIANEENRGFKHEECTAVKNHWPYEKSKVRKFRGILSEKSFCSYFSYLVPSYIYLRFQKSFPNLLELLEQLGFGIFTYDGNGKFTRRLAPTQSFGFTHSPIKISKLLLYLTSSQGKCPSDSNVKSITTRRRTGRRKRRLIGMSL